MSPEKPRRVRAGFYHYRGYEVKRIRFRGVKWYWQISPIGRTDSPSGILHALRNSLVECVQEIDKSYQDSDA